MRKEDFTTVACSRCGAEIGQVCTREGGKAPHFYGFAHRERIVLLRLGMTPDQVMEEGRRIRRPEEQQQSQIVDGVWMPDGYVIKEQS
ncbi:MAG: hypothetical protein ACJZ6B_06880 [Actinomycetes bacterium]